MSMNRRFLLLGAISSAAAFAAAPALAFRGNMLAGEKFPVSLDDANEIAPEYRRQLVDYYGPERPGTLVVDPTERYLYLVREDGTAMRYGIGVGRDGFDWAGRAQVKRKAEWPSWHPPAEMRKRQPDLPVMMVGGPENPLGARALYLFEGDRDTLYRIHGTNEPWTIGEAVSSGCIRMLNADVIDLYGRVPNGTSVVVLRQGTIANLPHDQRFYGRVEQPVQEASARQGDLYAAQDAYAPPRDVYDMRTYRRQGIDIMDDGF